MNPQHIVYLGIVLVGIGVSISAIDPLKPLPDIFGNLPSDYFSVGIVVEETEYMKKELIAPDTYRVTFYSDNNTEYDISTIPDETRNYFQLDESIFYNIDIESLPDSATITGIVCSDGSVERDIENMFHNGVYYEC